MRYQRRGHRAGKRNLCGDRGAVPRGDTGVLLESPHFPAPQAGGSFWRQIAGDDLGLTVPVFSWAGEKCWEAFLLFLPREVCVDLESACVSQVLGRNRRRSSLPRASVVHSL